MSSDYLSQGDTPFLVRARSFEARFAPVPVGPGQTRPGVFYWQPRVSLPALPYPSGGERKFLHPGGIQQGCLSLRNYGRACKRPRAAHKVDVAEQGNL